MHDRRQELKNIIAAERDKATGKTKNEY